MESTSIIVGLGRSGIAVAKLLQEEGRKAIIIEKKASSEYHSLAKKLDKEKITIKLGKKLEINTFTPWMNKISSVIISPGIDWHHPTLNILRDKGILVESEVSFAWKRLSHIPWIGITGTNGKTTVTHLIHHILKRNGITAPMCGNMGYPVSSIALDLKQNSYKTPDYLIVELSSYQIESSEDIAPLIGIWTSLSPDHLERHKHFTLYKAIKKSLLDKSKIRILNSNDKEIDNTRESFKDGIWINSQSPQGNDYWINQSGIVIGLGAKLFNSSVLNMLGEHNLQNLLLATAAARHIGISADRIQKSITSFPGIPHRLEKIADLSGVAIINDSKATNYHAAITGMRAIPKPSIILAGGQLKEGDPSSWVDQVKTSAIGAVLFGAGAKILEEKLKEADFNGYLSTYEDLRQATLAGLKLAKTTGAKSIVLSPASASFDQYKDFEERGNHFRSIIKEILNQGNK